MRGRPIDVRKSAVLLIAAVGLTGCNDTDAASPAPPKASPTATATSPAPAPTPTHRKLKAGAKGSDVKALQRRLKELGYDPGKADGKYGPSTQTAVWAFQAVNRLKQKTTLGKSFWEALDAPKEPRPMAKKREKNRVDVDLKRQYLVLYKDGKPRLISHISSGSGEYYCAKDRGATVPALPLRLDRHGRLPDGTPCLRLGDVAPGAALQPHLLQRRHRLPRRPGRPQVPRLARLRAVADAHRRVLPGPARNQRSRARQAASLAVPRADRRTRRSTVCMPSDLRCGTRVRTR
ncbi:peptidoglycan-binding domain-containing protein [Actinomadura madurae]|uniref:peptidoglycan-binding domain-containing protein n=1 Tax=Actinomadura madurae TaxID=1993 RepID=UPI003FD76F50